MIYPDPTAALECHPAGLAEPEPDHAGRMPSYVEINGMLRPAGEMSAPLESFDTIDARHPSGWLLFLEGDIDETDY